MDRKKYILQKMCNRDCRFRQLRVLAGLILFVIFGVLFFIDFQNFKIEIKTLSLMFIVFGLTLAILELRKIILIRRSIKKHLDKLTVDEAREILGDEY